jgi:hypothetical protein
MKAGFGTEEYFVWSRFDGATSLKDLILMTGLAVERAIAIVRALRAAGAILLPGEAAPPRAAAPPDLAAADLAAAEPAGAAATRVTQPMPVAAPPAASRTRTTAPMPAAAAPPIPSADGLAVGTAPVATETLPVPTLEQPTAAERAAMAEPGDLSLDEKARVLAGLRLVAAGDPWALVGVAAGSREAGHQAGVLRALEALPPRSVLRPPARGLAGAAPRRVRGDLGGPRPARREPGRAGLVGAGRRSSQRAAEPGRVRRRAVRPGLPGRGVGRPRGRRPAVRRRGQARPQPALPAAGRHCALAAGEPRTALAYANKVAAAEPTDPSTARILARALRAVDRADDAEEVLVMALAMKNENDCRDRRGPARPGPAGG